MLKTSAAKFAGKEAGVTLQSLGPASYQMHMCARTCILSLGLPVSDSVSLL